MAQRLAPLHMADLTLGAVRRRLDPSRLPKTWLRPRSLTPLALATDLELEDRERRRRWTLLGPDMIARRAAELAAAGVPIGLREGATLSDLTPLQLCALDIGLTPIGRGRPRNSPVRTALIVAALEDAKRAGLRSRETVSAVCRRLGVSPSQISKAQKEIATRIANEHSRPPQAAAMATSDLIAEAREVLAAAEHRIATAATASIAMPTLSARTVERRPSIFD